MIGGNFSLHLELIIRSNKSNSIKHLVALYIITLKYSYNSERAK